MISERRLHPFDVRRHGEPIKDVHLRDSVDPGISYTPQYMVFDAAIAAGATLDELARIEDYPKSFLAKLVAWHQMSNLIRVHQEDAVQEKSRSKGRK